MMLTFAYKNAYIHESSINGIWVQDMNFKVYQGFKSVRAAKTFITRRLKGGAK